MNFNAAVSIRFTCEYKCREEIIHNTEIFTSCHSHWPLFGRRNIQFLHPQLVFTEQPGNFWTPFDGIYRVQRLFALNEHGVAGERDRERERAREGKRESRGERKTERVHQADGSAAFAFERWTEANLGCFISREAAIKITHDIHDWVALIRFCPFKSLSQQQGPFIAETLYGFYSTIASGIGRCRLYSRHSSHFSDRFGSPNYRLAHANIQTPSSFASYLIC